jgi:hypothetical protein
LETEKKTLNDLRVPLPFTNSTIRTQETILKSREEAVQTDKDMSRAQ